MSESDGETMPTFLEKYKDASEKALLRCQKFHQPFKVLFLLAVVYAGGVLCQCRSF
jgi:hypothetical protein